MAAGTSSPEVLPWLKSLPVAPEYHPTLSEFKDPIAYILKIEPEASRYGICKIVPPLPAAPKPTAIANLNHSFSARSPAGDPTFTTRQQQIGFCPRRLRPVQKPVWQSGNRYTLSQFEAKARGFERAHLRKSCRKISSSSLSPLKVESLFWEAAADKPFSVEYANDMPGSGFDQLRNEESAAANVGETGWNMRGVARAKGSLLRFMKEEIPGVTSPMVYVAMMYSWFAWHVEDHDLHSMNYLHMGAGKTWYGVPRDAALAFEEVVRVHGYGGEVNALITFATLAEKTTVMSPEVLIGLGIPCCRLVQNAGEFVVTFPGSYHSGFSHGFNCGEASNIATPKWLRVAKEAAVRRAATNCPPMVSHYQLLYALALSLFLRSPANAIPTPKSSRLREKLRSAGEIMVKETFVQNVISINELLTILLDDYSSCVILPQSTSDNPLFSDLQLNSQIKVKPRIALGLRSEETKEEKSASDHTVGLSRIWTRSLSGFSAEEENTLTVYRRRKLTTSNISNFGASEFHNSTHESKNLVEKKDDKLLSNAYLDQGLLSCVSCGILSYACVAIIRPKEAAIRYLMSRDYNSFDDQVVRFDANCSLDNGSSRKIFESDFDSNFGNRDRIHSSVQLSVVHEGSRSDAKVDCGLSALDLLVSAYGELSDSEEDPFHHLGVETVGCDSRDSLIANCQNMESGIDLTRCAGNNLLAETSKYVNCCSKLTRSDRQGFLCGGKTGFPANNQHENINGVMQSVLIDDTEKNTNSIVKHADQVFLKSHDMKIRKLEAGSTGNCVSSFSDSTITGSTVSITSSNMDDSMKNSCTTAEQEPDKDSARMHVFCLEHAVEVEKQLRLIGGANIMLLCHPEYPEIESEAKVRAEELGLNYQWKEVHYREASKEDKEKIRLAIEDEQAIPCNSDWAVKLGINLYYSVKLSQSPLYRKQLPYNAVIYKSFAQKLPSKQKISGRVAQRPKKITVAGKWCGKVWMSNQVHPILANQNLLDDEQNADQNSDSHTDRENENQSIVARRTSSKNKAKDRRKSTKKRKRSSKSRSRTNVEPPSMRLRKQWKTSEEASTKKKLRKKTEKAPAIAPEQDREYMCDIEGCNMSFAKKHDLTTHKRNVCPEKGCGKKFFSHKYLLQHRKVHVDDRPLKCPWKGCKVTFKWAWARTEHIRVHTGERPYVCEESNCGLTFRFVSDFSRHKRKTGHYSAKKSRG
ncbi:Lysine-specific demethylase REF6 [Apostasia shenzhenica]|uniref:Lysine-specific demethylase REF6 n=1 Tax=Apostasia shenzhenica TaxID=1088818 RepID=A0A2I0B0F4_9ASPA|nr:Lysine-specific demethylase REF6 [Apostasia shenzhenica]